MLVQKYTRFFGTEHRDVEPGVVIEEEGIALVYTKVNGRTYVRPSTGAAGEVFAGFSVSRNSTPRYLPKVIAGRLVPDSGVIDLGRIPLTGQILVKVGGNVLEISANAPVEGKVQLQGQKLFFFQGTPAEGANPAVIGDIGKEVYVQFIYEPTVAEARTVIGDGPIGGLPSTNQERIGVATRMEELGTTYYDAAADWSGAFNPRLGADGRVTTAGNGTILVNVVVMDTPVADPASYGALKLKVIAA
jgi:hypothetical protein